MTEKEKLALISEVRELRAAIDRLAEYLEKQRELMLAEFKRLDGSASMLTIVSAEKPREETIDGARVVIFPGTIKMEKIDEPG